MMKIKFSNILLAVLLTWLTHYHSYSRDISYNRINPQREIEEINKRIEQYYINETVDLLIKLYANEFTFFPEYKTAIFDLKMLRQFHEDWFRIVYIEAYKKKIFKTEVYGQYILEIGTFNMRYSGVDNKQSEYKGKYMTLWREGANGELQILSETFGADQYINANQVPYADVRLKEITVTIKGDVDPKLKAEVEEINAEIIKAVEDGDGNARADGFTTDGIYMPHFDSMLVGMDAIRPYVIKIYTPSSLLSVRHIYNRIYDLGDFVFINGHFKGSWGDSVKGGKFEGNMSNLMKRDSNGKLLMHRQIGINDRD